MVTLSGSAVLIVLAIGYFGINAIVEKISGLFEPRKQKDEEFDD